jgi:hypothetical protein
MLNLIEHRKISHYSKSLFHIVVILCQRSINPVVAYVENAELFSSFFVVGTGV